MIKGKKNQVVDFDKKVKELKYERLYRSMKEISNLEIKSAESNEIDYAATYNSIKVKARLVLDFISDLDKENN